MRTIVFIGSNKSGSSREAIRAAERLGYYTVLLTDRQTFLNKRTEFPDVHKMVYTDFTNKLGMEEEIKTLQSSGLEVEAILSFIEPNVSTSIELAQKFGLNRFSLEAMKIMEDKIQCRKSLDHTPFNPFYMIHDEGESITSLVDSLMDRLPVVIKAPLSTGSKDVRRAKTMKQLERRASHLQKKYTGQPLLIEEFMPGSQYLVEVLVEQKVVTPVAIIEQDLLNYRGYMIIIGYAVLVNLPCKFKDTLTDSVTSIVRHLGMENGPCHLEMKNHNGQWKLIEINPRISGGAMNRMIEVACGINLVEETLKLAIGQKPELTPKWQRHVYTRYVTSEQAGTVQRIVGKSLALRVPGVEEVYVKPKKGKKLLQPTSMGNRYAYVIAADNQSMAKARAAAQDAARQIRFDFDSKRKDAT